MKLLRSGFAGLFLAMAMILMSAAETDAQTELGKTLRRMDEHNKNLTTLRAAVTMVKKNPQLGVSDTMVGTAIYAKRPGKDALVRIDWDRPKESLAVKDGQYTIYQERNRIAYRGSSKDAAKGKTKGASALAFMNMSKAQLDANYTAQFLGEGTLSDGTRTVQIRLTPKTKADFKTADLWVDKDGMPRQTTILEQNDDTTTVLLTKLEKNTPLKSSNFEIALAPGTKVQKS